MSLLNLSQPQDVNNDNNDQYNYLAESVLLNSFDKEEMGKFRYYCLITWNKIRIMVKRVVARIIDHRALAFIINIAVLITASPVNLLPAYLWLGFIPLSCLITYKFVQG